ncbi:hypothetical protein [Mesorhizobium sp. M0778]|uniref:hypothetical protein n=1 Tax=Mesorhizobium sp. M0778 TaxID=2956999 RepID=UPI00333836E4
MSEVKPTIIFGCMRRRSITFPAASTRQRLELFLPPSIPSLMVVTVFILPTSNAGILADASKKDGP